MTSAFRATSFLTAALAAVAFVVLAAAGQQATDTATSEGDFVVHNFQFHSGESLPEVRLHYTTLGKPVKDAQGRTTNAVLILHGTGGTGHQFLQPYFAGELFGPGQLLDTTRYFIILPDGVGHWKSSKPSDALHAHFPQYDYDDMVALHYKLLKDGLNVNHLRLILGTSMGCMHSFVWGETYPDFMDALMPMACSAGTDRRAAIAVWRKMLTDANPRTIPRGSGGDHMQRSRQRRLRTALDLLLIAGSAPRRCRRRMPDPRRRRQMAWMQAFNDVCPDSTPTTCSICKRTPRFLHYDPCATSWKDHGARDVDELRGRFHQSAGTGNCRARGQAAEERQIYFNSRKREDSRTRNAHLGGDLEGSSG